MQGAAGKRSTPIKFVRLFTDGGRSCRALDLRFENRGKRTIHAYAIAALSVFVALLIAHWPPLHLESAPVSLFLCAVIVSAWFGGAGPGCLAVGLSSVGFYYSFLPPVDSFVAKPGQVERFIVFMLSALLVGAVSVAQRRATEFLRKTRDDLKATVQKLKETNESLSRSEAYLAGAQTLSHTGSFGWDISTGEQFWSEETYRIFDYEPTVRAHASTSARTGTSRRPSIRTADHGRRLSGWKRCRCRTSIIDA